MNNATEVSVSADVLEAFMRHVYECGIKDADVIEDADMWREVLRIINDATVEGLMQSHVPTLEDNFLRELRHGNEVFSAFKVHAMDKEMQRLLIDESGKLKPFSKWRDDVEKIASHQCGAWLRTEYDTAVIRAHNAADWKEYERDKDIMPNLRWMPTTSGEPEAKHRSYWLRRVNLPVDHPFWNEHHPGDRWNCKCSLEQNDDPIVLPPSDGSDSGATPHRGLENNPGKDGHIYNDTHPYFPKSCNKCAAYRAGGLKNRLKLLFRNQKKDCYNCRYINNQMKVAAESMRTRADIVPPIVETYISSHGGKVLTSPYHGSNEVEENKRLAAFIADKLGNKVYLLPRLDPKNPIHEPLRSTLLPFGVFEDKNPDFYIGGLFFDGKSMMGLKHSCDKKKYHNAILNHIKAAKKQADNIVLEIPTFVSRRVIGKTVNGYLKQSSKGRTIIIKHGRKCYVYK
ncbi:MAG: hypothetical protein IJV60_04605 [Prevotella sp.]|nr:hypothetical protein [Prevotella sp.]